MSILHPWNLPLWGSLARLDALPAALLLSGPEGVGKGTFATALAHALLCREPQPDQTACARCSACRLLSAGNHPDLRVLDVATEEVEPASEPELARKEKSVSNWIRIDAIRGLRDFLSFSAHLAGRKVVLIQNADRLLPGAANALLKTLEEPPSATHFLLVTSHVSRLPVTVRSRCVDIIFGMPAAAQCIDWLHGAHVEHAEAALAYAGGAPLLAREQAGNEQWARRQRLIDSILANPDLDAVGAVDQLDSSETAFLIRALQRWCYDLLLAASVGQIRYHPDCARILHPLAGRASRTAIVAYLRELAEAARTAEHPLNPRLVAERCLIGYRTALRKES